MGFSSALNVLSKIEKKSTLLKVTQNPPGVFKPSEHKSGHEKSLRRTIEGLQVNCPENFKNAEITYIRVLRSQELDLSMKVRHGCALKVYTSILPIISTLALAPVIAFVGF